MFAFEGTFPDGCYPPAFTFKFTVIARITFTGSGNLVSPKIVSRRWPAEQGAIMPVPETTIDEYHSIEFRKNHIRFSCKIFAVQSKTITSFVESTSYDEFWLRVLPFNRSHVLAARFGAVNISQLYVALEPGRPQQA